MGKTIGNFTGKHIKAQNTLEHGFSFVLPTPPYDGETFNLDHPRGFVLTLLENDFQKLLGTNNLFEFITIAS